MKVITIDKIEIIKRKVTEGEVLSEILIEVEYTYKSWFQIKTKSTLFEGFFNNSINEVLLLQDFQNNYLVQAVGLDHKNFVKKQTEWMLEMGNKTYVRKVEK